MYVRLSVLVIVLAVGAFGQASDTPFQVRYAANLNIGDSGVTLTNTGASMTSGTNGILCANVYVLDPAGAPISCSSYVISPNVTLELSVKKDLIRTAPALESVVIKCARHSQPRPAGWKRVVLHRLRFGRGKRPQSPCDGFGRLWYDGASQADSGPATPAGHKRARDYHQAPAAADAAASRSLFYQYPIHASDLERGGIEPADNSVRAHLGACLRNV